MAKAHLIQAFMPPGGVCKAPAVEARARASVDADEVPESAASAGPVD